MNRIFDTHKIRPTKSLDGLWNFSIPGIDKNYVLPVPSCWEQHPDFNTYKGIGVFSKTIYLEKDTNIRLEFKGISHTADVFVDGEHITHHYNAYTPFSCIIQDLKAGEHNIMIKVNNAYGETSALHIPNDYYTYGGITRPVSLEYVPDVYIKNVKFTPEYKDGKWFGKTKIHLVNLTDERKTIIIKTELAGVLSVLDVILAGKGETVHTFESVYENVKEWSNYDPQLYYLYTEIDDNGVKDDLIERVGFRVITFDKSWILLNGKPIFLKGFNRHEDYPVVGSAIPLQLMVSDIDIIQDLGGNAIRTCHYPNDERFLDLCDERGILVWEENHARGLEIEQMMNPHFETQCKDCIDEMIENHYNHPSILIWGVMNECASDKPEGRMMYKKQLEQIKSLDKSRYTSFASNKYYTDVCFDLPDIVSYNVYNGWYTEGDTLTELNRLLDWVNDNGGKDKPVIISEFGAGGIYGYRDNTKVKWSEERQRDILQDNIECYLYNKRLAGIFVWMFADCRVDEEKWFPKRPKTQNNKGIVDIYRRHKLSYDVVKKLFNDEDM